MAVAWEEQDHELLGGLVEPEAAPSPSIFLTLPPTPVAGDDENPASSQPHDDLVLDLDYISRMLMEDNIGDKFLYQYPDHPAVLHAEKPFAQILSDTTTTTTSALSTTSSDALDAWPCSSTIPIEPSNMLASALLSGGSGQGNNTGSTQDPAFFSKGTDAVEPSSSSSLFPAGENSTRSMDMLSSLAFFKGMEEAKRFLPRDHETADGRGRKNKLCWELNDEKWSDSDVGGSSKQLAASNSEEEAAGREMLDQIILNGYNMFLTEMRELHVSREREKKAETRGRRGARQAVVDLHTLLIRCAEAVAANDRRGAGELLERIKRHSSPTGDATQRLAHFLAEGLEARLAGTGSRIYQSLTAKRTPTVMILKAYQLYMAACCFFKVTNLFSNMTIYRAVAGRQKLHIVHYGINHGFQWPKLLRWLGDRVGGPPEVRITGIDTPQPGFRPAEKIEEAGRRLSRCARQLGVPFRFHAIAAKSEVVRAEDLEIDPDEVLVVNSVFNLQNLMDESVVVDRLSPRDLVLSTIRKMKPSVFVHGVVNGSYGTAFFVTRFREALYDFTAQFDMMDATMPRDKDERLVAERDFFAPSLMNIVACEGADRVERPQNYRQWEARSRRAGLRQLPLDADIVGMLRETVKKHYHKNFVINEDHRWLLLGWKGRMINAVSAWTSAADDAH